jgi:citrate lyase subunit beta/citryl-CoA lyase
MGGGSTEGGDLARSIGLQWTPAATETLYIRSKVLVDVRAAGIPNPMSGIVSSIDRLDEVESFARQSRQLGYEGLMVIHPSHLPVVNRIFTPTESERTEAREIISRLGEAAGTGSAAVTYKGRMIDAAMIRTAEQLLGGVTEG